MLILNGTQTAAERPQAGARDCPNGGLRWLPGAPEDAAGERPRGHGTPWGFRVYINIYTYTYIYIYIDIGIKSITSATSVSAGEILVLSRRLPPGTRLLLEMRAPEGGQQ